MSKIRLLFLVTVFLHVQQVSALNLTGYRFTDSYRYALLEDSLLEKFEGRYVFTASYGHDSFLLAEARQAPLIAAFLEDVYTS